MKKVIIEGKICIGPTFSNADFKLIKDNLRKQRGLQTLAGLLATAGNFQRLQILYLLHAHRKMCVCDIAEVLGISVSAVSQHLRKLKDKNMVTSERDAQTIYYSLGRNVFTETLRKIFMMEERKEEFAFVRTG
jgi:DNA-binding transcriptional ArsR family regulator